MAKLKDQNKIDENIDMLDMDGIEFIEYDIDEDTETYRDDVAKLSKEAKKKQEKAEFSWKKEIYSWIIMIVVAIGIAAFVSTFILMNAVVPTGSMENTIPTGSRMIGFRLAYAFSEPERGDIVIFKSPLNDEEDYVKRIIGLPGETVVLEDSKVYIYNSDGSLKIGPLDEPYLKNEVWLNEGEKYKFVIPKDRYLMLGDNRRSSLDARSWYDKAIQTGGDLNEVYIHKDKILAQALFVYWDKFMVFEDVQYK